MFNKKKVFVTGAMMALGMAVSGGAAAQTILVPAGPVEINGYVSVNNTAKPGGVFTDFACKVKGYGRILDGSNQIRIEGMQAQHRSSGQVPRGCHGVVTANFPWIATIGVPAGGPPTSTSAVTVTGIVFQAPAPNPGCGTNSGTTGGSLTALWTQDSVPWAVGNRPFHSTDPAYSTISFTNATISETSGPACTITGLLKVTRPVAPSMTVLP